jgi:cardiolipin synthase A/B
MNELSLLLDIICMAALGIVGTLLFLVLFEPGLYYRVAAPVHALQEDDKLALLTALLGAQVRSAAEVRVFHDGADFYAAQLEAIASAQETVHLEAYIFRPGAVADRFIEALSERAAAGVRVRVIVDAFGSRGFNARRRTRLRRAGVEAHRYHAPRWYTIRRLNNRTHRNLLIVDGAMAFLGGAGIANFWQRAAPPPWRDTVVAIRGELVRGLQTVFSENWLECTGELLASDANFPTAVSPRNVALEPDLAADAYLNVRGVAVGSTPTSGRSNQARVMIQFLLAAASQRILICSPYFIPDRGIRRELIAARQRGVHVEVITGGRHTDHHLVRRAGRKRFGPLLQAGVVIHEYDTRMLHAKVMIVDDLWAILGTTNFDHRSFGLNDEVNAVLLSRELCNGLTSAFQHDRKASKPFTFQDWQNRSYIERLLAWLGTVTERHQ